jgi:GntP family gluconate:H+ symporter
VLLAFQPILHIKIDPLVALPAGGVFGALAMGRIKEINQYAVTGLNRTLGVAILLLCTGCIAGIIANSTIRELVTYGLRTSGLPSLFLAPFAGMLLSGATASTTSGAAVASATFKQTILSLGIRALSAAAMINAGATVLDHLPHGSFFHASGGSVNMTVKNRLKLIPYETLIGFTMVVASAVLCYFFPKVY